MNSSVSQIPTTLITFNMPINLRDEVDPLIKARGLCRTHLINHLIRDWYFKELKKLNELAGLESLLNTRTPKRWEDSY